LAVEVAASETNYGIVDGFLPWIRSFSTELDFPIEVTIDGTSINGCLDQWELDAIPKPAFDGDIAIVDGHVRVTYPTAGMRIDRVAARAAIESAMLDRVER